MKKTFITAAMLAAASFITPNVKAEGGSKSFPISVKNSVDPRTSTANPDAAELAKKAQVEMYRGSDGQVWETFSDKQSICSFTLDSLHYRALYDNKGNWRWTEKSYQGAALNEEIKNTILEHFGEVTIDWVDEITLPNSATNFFIVISTDKTIRRIRVADDKLDTIEEFVKN